MVTDPLLSTVKLINEPWDLGPNGWNTGRFPAPTADWNDHFRNTVRSFWLAQPRSITSGGGGGDLRTCELPHLGGVGLDRFGGC